MTIFGPWSRSMSEWEEYGSIVFLMTVGEVRRRRARRKAACVLKLHDPAIFSRGISYSLNFIGKDKVEL